MLKKRLAVLFLLMFLFLLGLAACGGSDAPVDTASEPASEPEIQATQPLEYDVPEEEMEEETAEEAVEEEMEEEMAEEAAAEEEPAEEVVDEPIEAVGSEDDDGSPFDPDDGPKVQETRTAGDGWVDETVAEAGEIARTSDIVTATPTATAVAVAGSGGGGEGASVKVGEEAAAANTALIVEEGYLAYLAHYMDERLRIDTSERQVIVVVDKNERPLAGATIDIVSSTEFDAVHLRTNSSGRVVFFPQAYAETAAAENFTLIIRYEGAEHQVTFSRAMAAPAWTIQLDIGS
ncbi:MAG: hypothetical protein KDE51_26615 [Anaerolineales bacterium]|nr:hypothetical protein [Anaerolineales bacterium]